MEPSAWVFHYLTFRIFGLTLYSYIEIMGYAEKCCLQCKAIIIATCKGCSSGNKESLNASNYNSVAPVAAAVQK